jgi:hypothetical protein
MPFEIIVILVFAFLLRIFPRILLPYAISDDTFGHFENAQMIRDNNFKVPKYYSKTLFPQIMGYPFGYMYLLALFKKKHEIIVEILTSPLFDVAQIFVSYLLFQDVCLANQIPLTNYDSMLFVLILSVLPTYLRNDTGPRAYQGSARVIGQFLFTFLIYSYFNYLGSENVIWFLLAALAGSLIFVFSTFATQVFVFIGIIIGLIYRVDFLFLILVSFTLFYGLTLGKAKQIVVGRFGHYEWYFKFYQKVNLQHWKNFKNPIMDFLTSIKEWISLLFKMHWKSVVIYFNISNNPFAHLVFSYFFYFSLFGYSENVNTGMDFLFLACIACLIVFFLTMLKPLLFLGECYRYLEFTIPASMILLFTSYSKKDWFYFFVIAWILISVIRYVFYQIEFYKNNLATQKHFKTYLAFFKEINGLISGNVYASQAFRSRAAYFGNFNYLGNRGTIQLWNLPLEDNKLAFGNYPFPSGDFKTLIKRFDLKYWLTTTSDLNNYLKYTADYGDFMNMLEVVAKDERIDTVLYRIKD